MKIGDLVVATRKKTHNKDDFPNRYLGIYIKDEFGDNMSVEIAKDYVDRDFPNEFFAVEIANDYIDDQDAFNEIFEENV